MIKNIEISTDDIEELYALPGFIPVSRYAQLVPTPREVGAVNNVKFTATPEPRDSVITARQGEIKHLVAARRAVRIEIASLQAECSMLGHVPNLQLRVFMTPENHNTYCCKYCDTPI